MKSLVMSNKVVIFAAEMYFVKLQELQKSIECLKQERIIDYLFVGVSFFANVQGVQWFIDNIMPNVEGHLWVIGKGMDKVIFEHLTDRIHILGFVDDLSPYYYRARIVVSPIFTGAGMKTKTAEALMYGKTIIGTTEAFEGYIIDPRCMICCNDKEEFIKQVVNTYKNSLFNEHARLQFITHYSNEGIKNKLKSIFN